VLVLNDDRATPAIVRNDGKDFVPTNRWMVFVIISQRSPGRDRSLASAGGARVRSNGHVAEYTLVKEADWKRPRRLPLAINLYEAAPMARPNPRKCILN